MALACLWSPGIRLLANRTHGVVVKRLFVSRPGRSLAVFGRHSIGSRSIALTPISVAAAPRLLTRRERLRSEEHTSELQSRPHLVCRLLLEKKNDLPVRSATLHVWSNVRTVPIE